MRPRCIARSKGAHALLAQKHTGQAPGQRMMLSSCATRRTTERITSLRISLVRQWMKGDVEKGAPGAASRAAAVPCTASWCQHLAHRIVRQHVSKHPTSLLGCSG